jgi:hypothetical protein
MTELAVNTWLKHWLTRQQKSKRPLMLKDPSEHHATTRTIPKVGSGSKTRIQWVEPDDEEIEPIEDEEGEENTQDNDDDDGDGSEQPGNGPATPASCAQSRKSQRTFLGTLSQDAKFQQLLQLLDAAKVSFSMMFGTCPD